MSAPVLVSKSGRIGNHRIVREIGRVVADPSKFGSDVGWGILSPGWADDAEAIQAITKIARKKKANGIIFLNHDKLDGHIYGPVCGIAVRVSPLEPGARR